MRTIIPLFLTVALMPGCGALNRLMPGAAAPPPAVEVAAPVAVAPVLGAGKTAATLDTTTPAQKQAALAVAPVSGERALGQVSVSLGSPAEPGFWLRSTLVTAPGAGRVETADGTSVAVELRPGTTGAQLSLAAFRALGLSLTALPQVAVFAQ